LISATDLLHQNLRFYRSSFDTFLPLETFRGVDCSIVFYTFSVVFFPIFSSDLGDYWKCDLDRWLDGFGGLSLSR
jgi:hypothetical protein